MRDFLWILLHISCITIYRSQMNNEQCEPSPLPSFIWVNKFVQSEAVAALFLTSPQGWWCRGAMHTLLQRYLWTCVRRKQRMSLWGIRASSRPKWAGGKTYSHFGVHFIPSVSVCLSLCHSLVTPASLSLSVRIRLCFRLLWLYPLPLCHPQ